MMMSLSSDSLFFKFFKIALLLTAGSACHCGVTPEYPEVVTELCGTSGSGDLHTLDDTSDSENKCFPQEAFQLQPGGEYTFTTSSSDRWYSEIRDVDTLATKAGCPYIGPSVWVAGENEMMVPGVNNGAGTVEEYGPDGFEWTCTGAACLCNEPPDCSAAVADPAVLWPPNHKMRDVTITVPDPDGDTVTVTVTEIVQDEPLDSVGDGNTPEADGEGLGTDTARLRAERQGGGNGRVYKIAFTADDGAAGTCDGFVTVCVPHDKGDPGSCVDDGLEYDSTQL